jgi:hypothetical protein
MDGGRRTPRGSLVAALVLLAFPAGAGAAAPPRISAGPVIDGTAQAGSILSAQAEWRGDPAPVATWAWLRCPRLTGPCSEIQGATAQTYEATASDVGSVLRVMLTVTNSVGSDEKRSAPTWVVAAAPPPSPAPTSTPEPQATAVPQATTVPQPTVASAAPPPSVPPRPAAAPAPRILSPFPVVRIKGVATAGGARVTLLSVTAPRGVRITATCRGDACPVRRYVAAAGERRLRRFERKFAAGARLEVRITRPGYIGKSSVFVIRRHAAPRRIDRCLAPDAVRVVRCPA